MSDLDAMAREHSELELFIKDALSDKYFNLKNDQDTIDFLEVIFDGAHKQHDMSPMQVTEKKLMMKKEDILKAIKEVLAENATLDKYAITPQNKSEVEKELRRKGYKGPVVPGDEVTAEDVDLGHQDDEPHMIKSELYKVAKYALELYKMVDQFEGKGEVDFPAWWQSKITKATSMISSAKHYLEFELTEPAMDQAVIGSETPIAEKLDPVGHEDEDIDNDGKENTKTDKYLKGRRVKIGQAIAQHSKKK